MFVLSKAALTRNHAIAFAGAIALAILLTNSRPFAERLTREYRRSAISTRCSTRPRPGSSYRPSRSNAIASAALRVTSGHVAAP